MTEVTKKVLVEVPSLLWQEVQDRAKSEGRFVRAVVTEALRQYVTGLTQGPRRAVQTTAAPTASTERPTAEQLRDLVNAVKPGSVVLGKDLTGVSSRQAEAERIAEQNRLRTHPEDESQAPDDW